MKLNIRDGFEFELIAENYQDKLYLWQFMKQAYKKEAEKFMELDFSYSDQRINTNAPQGGGYADPQEIVDNFSDAENEDKICVSELNSLRITNYQT